MQAITEFVNSLTASVALACFKSTVAVLLVYPINAIIFVIIVLGLIVKVLK